jgi:hypothetical protein
MGGTPGTLVGAWATEKPRKLLMIAMGLCKSLFFQEFFRFTLIEKSV